MPGLHVNNFPDDLRRKLRISAYGMGMTLRELVIRIFEERISQQDWADYVRHEMRAEVEQGFGWEKAVRG